MEKAEYDGFNFLVNAPALFNAVTTAAELGIFRLLAKHPGREFEEVREHTGVPPHRLRVLLRAVCATGLLKRSGEVYRNSTAAEELPASAAGPSWPRATAAS
ncbi:hypothetical protein GCM10022252_71580 [Streptosporangium oxazolinicum]|uniref:O-methyltransferase dimerisation domain-containing protein n=1 Tax=Streptosporangium oxazolinicum TaxID=909287 RepID=A0ABP8BJN5_9ACTN